MVKRMLFALLVVTTPCIAQQSTTITGTFSGVLTGHTVLLHFTVSKGNLACTADSPAQNMTALPCVGVSLKGQSLSFTVPSVRGSWVGFVSDDGTALTGTWNQGAVSQLNFARVQPGADAASTAASGAYTFRLDPTSKSGPIMLNGQVVGQVYGFAGKAHVTPTANTDLAGMQTAYAAFASSPGGMAAGSLPLFEPGTAAQATAVAPTSQLPQTVACGASDFRSADAQPSGTVSFDGDGQAATVTRTDGVMVRFDAQETKITCGRVTWEVRHAKGSGMKMLGNSILHPKNNGGSITGAGTEFFVNGSMIYDSGAGHYGDMNTNFRLKQAKMMSVMVVAAVSDVRKVDGHQSFTPPGYSDVTEIAQYKLTSDGSR